MRNPILTFIAASALGYAAIRLLRPSYTNWGATPEEQKESVPGEEYLSDPKISSTQAITINASPDQVWPWLIQVGSGRGGFYSYAWLENLVGCKVKNVDRIIPGLQTLKQGDLVYLHPKAPPLKVTYFEKNRALALEGWIFLLKPINANQTRMIVRTYFVPTKPDAKVSERLFNKAIGSAFFDFAHFIMGRKQLLEIKRLAEDLRESEPTINAIHSTL